MPMIDMTKALGDILAESINEEIVKEIIRLHNEMKKEKRIKVLSILKKNHK